MMLMGPVTSLVCLFLSLCLIDSSNGLIFYRGRPVNGSLGLPNSNKQWDPKDLPPPNWFDQKLDHFDVTSDKTWKQRYFVNDSFYEEGGPVFLQIGGEGRADPIWLVVSQCMKFAQRFKAMVFLLEHRYYGDSHPTADMSTENLKYLSSEQALADLAVFREHVMAKHKLPPSTKWISFGGSYPGSLAAWFRLKYPHLVHASISSSAPMVAVIDFKDYLRVVRNSLATTGPTCNAAIQDATHKIGTLLQHRMGWQYLTTTFNLCDDLDPQNKDDLASFFQLLAGNFENVVQYNKDNRAFEGVVGYNVTIDTLCSIMNNASLGDTLKRYAAVNDLILNTYSMECADYKYSKSIDGLKNVSWSSSASEGGRQWTYQTCTEFGYFQSSDLEDQPFGNHFSVDFFIKQCKDIYGDTFNLDLLKTAIKRTNIFYGGRNITLTRVMFINGSIDPWHALGITKSSLPDVPAILINGTAHCANMYPDSPDDPPQLRQARAMIENQIRDWLKE